MLKFRYVLLLRCAQLFVVLASLGIIYSYSMGPASVPVPKIESGTLASNKVPFLKHLVIKKIAQRIGQDIKQGKNFKKWFNKPLPEDLYEAIEDELIKYHLPIFLSKYPDQIKFSRVEIKNNFLTKIASIDLSPDDQFLAIGSNDSVRVISVDTTKEIFCCPKEMAVTCVKFSRDKLGCAPKLLFVGLSDGKIHAFDMTKVKNGLAQHFFSFERHTSFIAQMIISNDGTFLISRSYCGNKVYIWNIKLLKHACALVGHRGDIKKIAIANNDEFIVTISEDKTAKVWNFKGKLLQTFENDFRFADGLLITSDSKYIVTGSYKNIRLWQVNSPTPIATFKQESIVSDFAITPDNKTLFIATIDALNVANLTQANLVLLKKDRKNRRICSLTGNDSIMLCTSKGRCEIFDFEGNCPLRFEEPQLFPQIVSKNGKYIIAYNFHIQPANKSVATTQGVTSSLVIFKLCSNLKKLLI